MNRAGPNEHTTDQSRKDRKEKMTTTDKKSRGRPPGIPKTGGRQPGTPNRVSLELRKRLKKYGCDLDKVLAEAIANGKIDMINAIAKIMPYAQPRLIEAKESVGDDDGTESTEEPAADLLALVRGEKLPE